MCAKPWPTCAKYKDPPLVQNLRPGGLRFGTRRYTHRMERLRNRYLPPGQTAWLPCARPVGAFFCCAYPPPTAAPPIYGWMDGWGAPCLIMYRNVGWSVPVSLLMHGEAPHHVMCPVCVHVVSGAAGAGCPALLGCLDLLCQRLQRISRCE
jgi:hypothetical protein